MASKATKRRFTRSTMLSPAARLLLMSVALNPACTEGDAAMLALLGGDASTPAGGEAIAERLRRQGWTCTPPVVKCGTTPKTRARAARKGAR